jgi:hypothetical protein
MKKRLLYWILWLCSILFGFLFIWWDFVYADGGDEQLDNKVEDEGGEKCEGIKLNTDFPLIWNCIELKGNSKINPTEAFPTMVAALTKIVMSVILVVCLILIIVWGIMIASDNKIWQWKNLIKKVAIVILLLWFSSLILKLINPNFFG